MTPTSDLITKGREIYLTRAVLEEILEQATADQQSFLERLFNAEIASRYESRKLRLLKQSKLPVLKQITNFDWTPVELPADIDKHHIENLGFLKGNEDLVFYGDVGTGKTHLASALVAHACSQGIKARFFTTASLVEHLRTAKKEDKLDKELKALGKNQLLVVDELGYLPIDEDGARLLFQAIADAYEQRSLIITTNLPFSQWGQVFGNNDMAAAAIDRIVHHGRLLKFTGKSYRVAHALMR